MQEIAGNPENRRCIEFDFELTMGPRLALGAPKQVTESFIHSIHLYKHKQLKILISDKKRKKVGYRIKSSEENSWKIA